MGGLPAASPVSRGTDFSSRLLSSNVPLHQYMTVLCRWLYTIQNIARRNFLVKSSCSCKAVTICVLRQFSSRLVGTNLPAWIPQSCSGSRGGLGRRGPSHPAAARPFHSLPTMVLCGPLVCHSCRMLSILTRHTVLHKAGEQTSVTKKTTRTAVFTRFRITFIFL